MQGLAGVEKKGFCAGRVEGGGDFGSHMGALPNPRDDHLPAAFRDAVNRLNKGVPEILGSSFQGLCSQVQGSFSGSQFSCAHDVVIIRRHNVG